MNHWLRYQDALYGLKVLRTLHLIVISLLLWANAMIPAHAESTLVRAGNVLQVLLPVGAGAISLYRDDTEGLWQLTKSELLTAGVTYGLKYSINSTGPNGEHHKA